MSSSLNNLRVQYCSTCLSYNCLACCFVLCRASSLRHLLLHSLREVCFSNSWYWEVAPHLLTSVRQHQGISYQSRKVHNFHPSSDHVARSNCFFYPKFNLQFVIDVCVPSLCKYNWRLPITSYILRWICGVAFLLGGFFILLKYLGYLLLLVHVGDHSCLVS